MEPIRLRLKFSDGDILSDSQKLDGLRRSWILVEPQHRTIFDVISHLIDGFELSGSCPEGVYLSMDGFVLPPFESTAILRDKDTVCVKRKGARLLDVANESRALTVIPEILPLDLGMQLLAGEEFEKETGDYRNETEEDEGKLQNDSLHHIPNGGASTKKRKASKQLISSKEKKSHQNDSPSAHKEHNGGHLQKNEDLLHDRVCTPKAANNGGAVKCTANAVCNNPNENREGAGTASGPIDVPKKASGARRASRRAARKRWLRSLSAAERQQRKKDQNPDAVDRPEEADQDTDTGDEIVAVVVRPGHIRFTAPGKEKSVLRQQEEKGPFDWCGSVNKKKSRNRGKKKKLFSKQNEQKAPRKDQSASKWSDHRSTQEKESTCPWDDFTSTQEKKSKWGEYRSQNRPSRYRQNEYGNRRIGWASQRAQPANASINYEKLIPLTDFPVEGDIIAYRVLGMNSSSCPELTSYRVGKVSRFESESNTIMLVPVPEYPFEFKTAADNLYEEVPDAYRYKEDGSLEIDYPSLADVRTVKLGNMNLNTTFRSEASGAPSSSWNPTSGWNPTSSGWNPGSSGPGLGTRSPARNSDPSSQAPSSGSRWGSASGSGWGAASGSGWGAGTSASDKEPPAQPASSNWTATRSSPAPETGSKDVWEALSSALSAEKAEALREENWQKKRACASRLLSAGPPRGGGRPFGRFRGRNGR